jgi:hypothetical protein
MVLCLKDGYDFLRYKDNIDKEEQDNVCIQPEFESLAGVDVGHFFCDKDANKDKDEEYFYVGSNDEEE